MHIDFVQPFAQSHVEHGVDVVLVAVHAAIGEQTENVQRAAIGLELGDDFLERGVAREVAAGDGAVDTGVFLIHHPSCADIEVADFGVAHLPRRQAHSRFGRLDQGVRIAIPVMVEVRFSGTGDGIEVVGPATTEAIQDDQENGRDRCRWH